MLVCISLYIVLKVVLTFLGFSFLMDTKMCTMLIELGLDYMYMVG